MIILFIKTQYKVLIIKIKTKILRYRVYFKKNRSAMTVNEIENVEDSEMTKNIQQTVFDQSIDDCVALGIQKFNAADPDRGYAILLQMDGYAIKDIAMRIDRTPAATKEFLRQVRIKLAPFIKHCLDIIE